MFWTSSLKLCPKAHVKFHSLSLVPVLSWHPLWPRKEWSRSWWHPMIPQAAREREKRSGKSPKKAMQSYVALTTQRLQFAWISKTVYCEGQDCQHLVQLLVNRSFWLELFCGTRLLRAEPFGTQTCCRLSFLCEGRGRQSRQPVADMDHKKGRQEWKLCPR